MNYTFCQCGNNLQHINVKKQLFSYLVFEFFKVIFYLIFPDSFKFPDFSLMAYLHRTWPGLGTGLGQGLETMAYYVTCWSFDTTLGLGPGSGMGPGPMAHQAIFVPFSVQTRYILTGFCTCVPVPFPLQCENFSIILFPVPVSFPQKFCLNKPWLSSTILKFPAISMTGKTLLIFPGFPVQVETLGPYAIVI